MTALHAEQYGGKSYIKAVEEAIRASYKAGGGRKGGAR
jgi:hypothetical protein